MQIVLELWAVVNLSASIALAVTQLYFFNFKKKVQSIRKINRSTKYD